MAISEKLDYLLDTKQAIKQAIIDKGQEVADTDTFRSYAEKIEAIEAGGAGLEYNIEQVLNEETGAYELRITDNPDAVKDMLQARVDATNSCAYLFYQYSGTELNISRLDTSNVISMSRMFNKCSELTELDVSNLKTSNVTTMYEMFASCAKLTSIDISTFNTSNVTSMYNMFAYCRAITQVNINGLDTSNVTNMYGMFQDNAKLLNIIGVINMINITSTSLAFNNCTNLTNVTLKNIKVNLQLGSGTSYGHLLSLDSLTNAINELWNLTGSTAKTLTIGTANLEKLANVYVKLVTITDEMRAEDEYIDNKLPCVVCDSTDEGAMLILDYAQTLKNWVIA